jgi:hypothetical protein
MPIQCGNAFILYSSWLPHAAQFFSVTPSGVVTAAGSETVTRWSHDGHRQGSAWGVVAEPGRSQESASSQKRRPDRRNWAGAPFARATSPS